MRNNKRQRLYNLGNSNSLKCHKTRVKKNTVKRVQKNSKKVHKKGSEVLFTILNRQETNRGIGQLFRFQFGPRTTHLQTMAGRETLK